jgi:hypothetical protein
MDLRTPYQVQKYLHTLEYHLDDTLTSALTTFQTRRAHCFEGAMLAAALLELQGYPPLVMSFESQDSLDHVVFVFQYKNKWGAVGKSRDPGLYGRKPVYGSLKELAVSYFDPYIDKSAKITAYQIAHMDDSNSDWRSSKKNVWKAERYLLDLPHIKMPSLRQRYQRVLNDYLKNGSKPYHPNWW